jgi:signal transduction histidine kinase
VSGSSLKFTVDSLLLGELGERLVTKNYIALAELIKNAYDADATRVEVTFVGAKGITNTRKGEIKIVDDGHGMTFQQVKDYWMRIATPNKIREPISPRFGRKKTGDKGIGRFACRRLAKKLIVESIARLGSNKLERTRVEFDWEKFKPGFELTDVPNVYETDYVSDGNVGVTLKLEGLNDSWTQRDFDVLRRQVLGLSVVKGIRRKGFEEDPGFEIVLNAPGFDMGKGILSEQVMSAGWGLLKCSISDDGIALLKLEAKDIGRARFELPESYAEIAGVSYKIAIILQLKDCIRDSSTLTLSLIDDIFNQWSGVKVFLDGFRIYPYGDLGNDWLEIDKDVAQRSRVTSETFRRVSQSMIGVDPEKALLRHPRNQNLIGRVYISNTPRKIFEVTLNREGFLESTAFEKLKKSIRQGLEWATIYYSYFQYKQQQKKMEETVAEFGEIVKTYPLEKEQGKEVEERPALQSALDVLEIVGKENISSLPQESREELGRRTQGAIRIVGESVSYMQKQLNMLRTVASSGALMLTFMHEAKDVASRLDTHATELEIIAKKVDVETGHKILELAKSMRRTRDRFDNQIKLFGSVSKGLRATERTRLSVKSVFDDVKSCFEGLEADYNFTIETDIAESVKTGYMMEAELYSIVINLVSNAVKAVIASGDGRRVKVKALRIHDETNVRVYDDGIGLPRESRDIVFEPLAADPDGRLYKRLKDKIKYEDLLIIGEGTGMGLTIVKDIVEFYGKRVGFIDVQKPWSTCIEVTLP